MIDELLTLAGAADVIDIVTPRTYAGRSRRISRGD